MNFYSSMQVEMDESEVLLDYEAGGPIKRPNKIYKDYDHYKIRLRRFGRIWAGWEKMVDEPYWNLPRLYVDMDPKSIHVAIGWRWTMLGVYLMLEI